MREPPDFFLLVLIMFGRRLWIILWSFFLLSLIASEIAGASLTDRDPVPWEQNVRRVQRAVMSPNKIEREDRRTKLLLTPVNSLYRLSKKLLVVAPKLTKNVGALKTQISKLGSVTKDLKKIPRKTENTIVNTLVRLRNIRSPSQTTEFSRRAVPVPSKAATSAAGSRLLPKNKHKKGGPLKQKLNKKKKPKQGKNPKKKIRKFKPKPGKKVKKPRRKKKGRRKPKRKSRKMIESRPRKAEARPKKGATSVAVSAGNGASVAVSASRRTLDDKKRQKELEKKEQEKKDKKKKEQEKKEQEKKDKQKKKKKKLKKGATTVAVTATKNGASFSVGAADDHDDDD